MSPKAQHALDLILALRQYTQDTGFRTTRSQNDLLAGLEAADLADVLLNLNRKESTSKGNVNASSK